MKLYSKNENYTLYHGSMLDMLEKIDVNSIDSIICDPPYELNFMGKGWDNSGIAFNKEAWEKCYEVLKPGGYLLAFGGSRTFHRIACAIEDAGFEIRDNIMWLYGSGFPKSMDISKQIDKRNGKQNEDFTKFGDYVKRCRESKGYSKKQIDEKLETNTACAWWEGRLYKGDFIVQLPDKENYYKLKTLLDMNNDFDYLIEWQEAEREVIGKSNYTIPSKIYNISNGSGERLEQNITLPTTDLAKQWQGWGTCLKPSYEPIIVARKPFKGSLVDNVIEYGVGGLNIDECRVEPTQEYLDGKGNETIKEYENNIYKFNSNKLHIRGNPNELGRFPANTILTYDETDFDEVCGGFPNTKSGTISKEYKQNTRFNIAKTGKGGNLDYSNCYGDSGSAARYFMNCKYTGKDEEKWKQLYVNNVENNLEILKATKDNIVQMNVEDLLKELKDHYAKYVENQLDLIETPIVQDIVKISTWDFKIETSQVIQDFIGNYNKCIQFLNLVQFVEKMDNIDTTQTTQNLLKLFGYVKVVITNYIQGNIEFDQRRYIYTPKASKKDRDNGLNDIKNVHPTVKPTELMQYLVRLVNPKGATILDCFMGSGSTGKAVMYENKERNANYKFIGIELTDEYLPIAEARISYINDKDDSKKQLSMFDIQEEDYESRAA